MKLDGKQKTILFGTGMLLSTIFIFVAIITPQRERIATLSAQYQLEQQRINTIQVYVQKHPDPEQHIRDMEMKVSQLELKLPNQPKIGEFLKEIEQAAKLSGVKFAEIKPLASINRSGYREIPLEIQIKASFGNLLEFTKKVGEIQRFNSLTNINVLSKQDMLDVKLSLSIYSYGVSPEPVSSQPSQSPPSNK